MSITGKRNFGTVATVQTREHWTQRITFAAETNANTHTHVDTQHDAERYNLRSLSGGEGNTMFQMFQGQAQRGNEGAIYLLLTETNV